MPDNGYSSTRQRVVRGVASNLIHSSLVSVSPDKSVGDERLLEPVFGRLKAVVFVELVSSGALYS